MPYSSLHSTEESNNPSLEIAKLFFMYFYLLDRILSEKTRKFGINLPELAPVTLKTYFEEKKYQIKQILNDLHQKACKNHFKFHEDIQDLLLDSLTQRKEIENKLEALQHFRAELWAASFKAYARMTNDQAKMKKRAIRFFKVLIPLPLFEGYSFYGQFDDFIQKCKDHLETKIAKIARAHEQPYYDSARYLALIDLWRKQLQAYLPPDEVNHLPFLLKLEKSDHDKRGNRHRRSDPLLELSDIILYDQHIAFSHQFCSNLLLIIKIYQLSYASRQQLITPDRLPQLVLLKILLDYLQRKEDKIWPARYCLFIIRQMNQQIKQNNNYSYWLFIIKSYLGFSNYHELANLSHYTQLIDHLDEERELKEGFDVRELNIHFNQINLLIRGEHLKPEQQSILEKYVELARASLLTQASSAY